MSAPVEILLWAPSREVFAATLVNLTLPDGRHIAFLPEEGETGPEGGAIITIPEILCSEIGPVIKIDGAGLPLDDPFAGPIQEYTLVPLLDGNGEQTGMMKIIPGYHVNMVATGWLADMLTAGLPAEGTLFERTRILSLLGTMNWQPSAVGEPIGYVGTSGVKISDPADIDHQVRRWALPGLMPVGA